jgi:hypothetical protein
MGATMALLLRIYKDHLITYHSCFGDIKSDSSTANEKKETLKGGLR